MLLSIGRRVLHLFLAVAEKNDDGHGSDEFCSHPAIVAVQGGVEAEITECELLRMSTRIHDTLEAKIERFVLRRAPGLEPPGFQTLSRGEPLTAISDFQVKLAATPDAAEAATKLGPVLADFGELKPSLIPERWI